MTKKEARTLALNNRNNIDEQMRAIKSRIIVQKIEENIDFKNAKLIGVYYPFGSEVDISNLDHSNAKFAYPKIINGKMEFILVNKKTKWEKSSFGVLEPVKGKIVNEKIDLLIVSCLAKNDNKYRLGYGKGYYDNFLRLYPKKTIGILFDNNKIDFNEDLWDIPLDYYISN